MRIGCSTSAEAVDGFILNTHALTKLRRALKNRMNVKTSSSHKEFSHRQKKMHEQYIQQLLTIIPTDPFCGPARNIMSGLEISSKITNGLLAGKVNGEKLNLEFVKNRVPSDNKGFFETIKKSGITSKEEKKNTPKAISVLQDDCKALRLFVSKCTDKKAAFHYSLASYLRAIAVLNGKLYQPISEISLSSYHVIQLKKIHLRMQFIFMVESQ